MKSFLQNSDHEKYKSKFNFIINKIGKNIENIVEVGSHFGEDTLRFRHFFPNSFIYCFECDPRNIQIFEKTCQNINNIKLFKMAVSNKEDYLDFYQSYLSTDEKEVPTKYKFIG